MYEIINNENALELKSNYASGGTCGSFEITKVHFSDGTIKVIKDYRDSGPDSLKMIKSAIKLLIAESLWVEVESRHKPTKEEMRNIELKDKCHCGSGKRLENCHGLVR